MRTVSTIADVTLCALDTEESVMSKLILILSARVFYAASHDFMPNAVFKESSRGGWHKFRGLKWRVENGEIIAIRIPPREEDFVWRH